MTETLDEKLAKFIEQNAPHHGAGGWLENTLSDEELALVAKMYRDGYGPTFINRFLVHGLGYKNCSAGKVSTYLEKVRTKEDN